MSSFCFMIPCLFHRDMWEREDFANLQYMPIFKLQFAQIKFIFKETHQPTFFSLYDWLVWSHVCAVFCIKFHKTVDIFCFH